MTIKSFNHMAWDMFWAGLLCGSAFKDVVYGNYTSAGWNVVGMAIIMLLSFYLRKK